MGHPFDLSAGPALTLARRSLTQHPARTLFSVLGIAVGIATVVAIFCLDHNTILGRSRLPDGSWQAEIEVSPSSQVADPRAALSEVPGVASATAAFQNEVDLAPAERPQARSRVHLVALEAAPAGALGAYRVERGVDLDDPTAAGELPPAVVGTALLRDFELELGDTVLLARPRRLPGKECVNGEWVPRGARSPTEAAPRSPSMPFRIVGALAREGLGRAGGGRAILIDYARGRELFEGAHVDTRYWLKKDAAEPINLERLQAQLGSAWSYELGRSVIIGQAADERAFRNGVRFAGILALVLGLYVIFHTLSISLAERTKEVGVLHALGATRGQIGRVFFLEAILVSGLAGLLGLAGGIAFSWGLLRVGVTTVGRGAPVRFTEVPWIPVLPLTCAGIGVALLGSIYPVLRVRNMSSALALRGVGSAQAAALRGGSGGFRAFAALLLALVLPMAYFRFVPVIGEAQEELVGVLLIGLGIVGAFVAVPLVLPGVFAWACAKLAGPFERLWPLSGMLAARAMRGSAGRVAGAASGLALVAAGFVGLRGMTGSLESEIELWGREAFYEKVYVRDLPETDWATLRGVVERYGDAVAVEPNDARTYVPFLLVGTKPEEVAAFGPLAEDPELARTFAQDGGLILSTRLARHHEYAVGDEVHVRSARGEVRSLPVLLVTDEYGYFPHPDERLYALAPDAFLKDAFCIDTGTTTNFGVRVGPGVDAEAYATVLQTALRELHPDARFTVESGPWLYRWHTSDIRRDFILFDIILFLTVCLAGLGILNGQLLAGLERSKELGVLRALGMTRRQVAGMVLSESAVVGTLGGALGGLLGLLLAPVVVDALRTLSGLPLPSPSPGLEVLIAWGGAVVTAVVAGLYPVRRLERLSAVAAVRS